VTPDLYFAIPGDLATLTGGYAYDRRLLEEFNKLGFHVEPVKLPAGFPFPDQDALALTEQCMSGIPDNALVLVDGLAFGAMAQCVVRHARRLRFVELCHHPLTLESGLHPEQQKALHDSESMALQAAQCVIVTSHTTKHTLVNQFSIPETKICVALPGTDRGKFAPCVGVPPLLLCVASLTPRKAHDVLIDALARISDLPWQARFVGGERFAPDWSVALRQQIARLHLAHRIEVVGESENVAREYQNADLFVLPSRYEGYGMVFAEALAHGLPVIAARAGAVPDVVPESAGRLVQPDDATALAATLREVLTDAELYGRLRAGAQQAALSLPTWTDNAVTILTRLQQINTD
jgi:glycosyltransferase involved in cell wall biosynthesis